MNVIVTHIAEIQDAEDIARMNRLFNQVDLPLKHYTARLVDPRRVETPIFAEIEGRVVDFAAIRISQTIFSESPHAELTEIFVEEEPYRRRGVGKVLIAHAEQLTKENGAKDLNIATDFYNHAAQELYRAMVSAHYDIVLGKNLK